MLKRKQKIMGFLLLLALLCVMPVSLTMVYAEEREAWLPNGDDSLQLSWPGYEDVVKMELNETNSEYNVQTLKTVVINVTNADVEISVSSSNTDILQIAEDSEKITVDGDNYWSTVEVNYEMKKAGSADIQYRIGDSEYKVTLCIFPSTSNVKNIKQTDYKTLKLTWEKKEGVSGYLIERIPTDANNGEYTLVKTVTKNTGSASVTIKDYKEYRYRVIPYIEVGKEKYYFNYSGTTMSYQAKVLGTEIKSVKKSGSSYLKVTWNKVKDATGYKVYRSEHENDGYKCVYTVKSGSKTSWKHKATKGKQYYYYVVVYYSKLKSEPSKTVAQMIPKTDTKASKKDVTGMGDVYTWSQYSGNYARPDKVYYYEASGKLHVVCAGTNGIMDYTLNSKGKVTATKKISIKYDVFGGFYKGTDGKFYVAVGYQNPTESRTKTVIKVIQYNSKWKKLKTALIKSNASNAFEGIVQPFYAGNCSMEMKGDTLYLFTSRMMFVHSDGLNHQSNISFTIDTKKMKVSEANESYCSHSFNQYVRFKDDDLYLVDHGDAYPRSILITAVNGYEQGAYESIFDVGAFQFQGVTGDNYTGCTIGGMEVGNDNILVCGTSVPHKYKIKGVTGSDSSYKKNVYVLVTDRETGKTKVKWLTTYNPATSTTTVGQTRMLKLTEDRYVILYITTKNNKNTLHYVVIDNNGKKICDISYKNYYFSGGSQPILYNGNIVWLESAYNIDGDYLQKTKLYSIPAKFKK